MYSSRSPVVSPLSATLSTTLSPATSFPANGPYPAFDLDDRRDQSQIVARDSVTRLADWVEELDRCLQLPTSFRSFAPVGLGLLLFVVGAFIHLLLAVQILESKAQLQQLRQEYYAIEQQNGETTFLIARETNLDRLRQQVVAQGYVPITKRHYVFQPVPASADVSAADVSAADVSAAGAPPAPSAQQVNDSAQTLPNWQRWEAFLGLSSSAPTARSDTPRVVNTPADWELWWQRTLEQGSRLLENADRR